MLSFYRKIRKSLINAGALRKYLLYAIGEIMLVVIGILIALQINNQNESRKSKAEFRQSLMALSEEIKFDTSSFKRYLSTLEYQQKASKLLIPILESEETGIQDSLAFVDAFLKLSNAPDVDFNTEVWDDIRSAGLYKKYASPNVIYNIQEYYRRNKRYTSNFQNAYRKRIEWRELKYSLLSQSDLDLMRSDPIQIPSDDAFYAIFEEPHLKTLAKSIGYTSSLFLKYFNRSLYEAEECLKLIHKEIESLN